MITVYSRLSLDESSALKILPGARIAPPITRGDLLKDIDNGAQVVVIIDGKFHQDLAVTPDEIVDALSCGLRIYGASSMGALRASELYQFGMIGHGLIFEHIVATSDFRDDFLGQIFSESGGAIKIVSTTHVDFHMNLLELERQKRVTTREKKKLLKLYADLFYTERSWASLRNELCKCRRPDARLLKIAEEACIHMGSQKRRDAIGVLKRVRADLKHVRILNTRLAAG